MEPSAFTGKVAVITGGCSGIGLATAKRLVAAKARVAIIDRPDAPLEQVRQALGERALLLAGDLSRPGDIDDCLLGVEVAFGHIDILFINAGLDADAPMSEPDESVFDRITGVNFKGAFFTFSLALPLLAPGAAVIFASAAAQRGRPGDPLQSATTAAVRGLARTLAADPAVLAKGIRVNVVRPGHIPTPVEPKTGPNAARGKTALPGQAREAEIVAEIVAFLASPAACATTGSELAVDGRLAQIGSQAHPW